METKWYMVPALIKVEAVDADDAIDAARESVEMTHYGDTPVYIDRTRPVEEHREQEEEDDESGQDIETASPEEMEDGTPITRERLHAETAEEYHWRQVKLEEAGLLPPTDSVGREHPNDG